MPSICRYLWPITNHISLWFAPSACQLDALPRLGHRLGQIALSHLVTTEDSIPLTQNIYQLQPTSTLSNSWTTCHIWQFPRPILPAHNRDRDKLRQPNNQYRQKQRQGIRDRTANQCFHSHPGLFSSHKQAFSQPLAPIFTFSSIVIHFRPPKLPFLNKTTYFESPARVFESPIPVLTDNTHF